jgi:hypothetical protein
VEENMFKPVIVGLAVLAVAGSSLVYAQRQFGDHEGFGRWRAEHRTLSADDMAAFTDARIAALKAGLELTPDQAKNWSPFEQAVRELAQLRIQQAQARQQLQQRDNASGPFGRLGQRADNLAKTSAALKKVADAGAPLYQSLTDAQKGRFRVLARMLRPHPRRAMFLRRGRDGDREFGHGDPGFGPRTAPNDGSDNDTGNRP